MRTHRRARAAKLSAYLLAWAQLAIVVPGCRHTIDSSGDGYGGSASLVAGILGNNDIGEAVFKVYRDSVAKEPDPQIQSAKLAALDARHDPFVKAVNDIINVRTLGNVGQSAEPLFKLVDDGTIPGLSEDMAQVLELFSKDPRAIDAIVGLLRTRNQGAAAPPIDDMVALLGRLSNYPETEQLWTASAQLIDANKPLVNDGLALASKQLKAIPVGTNLAPTGTLAKAIQNIEATVLDEARLRSLFNFGSPEYVVRMDDRNAPVVAIDPATKKLYAPFVDDGSGRAKLDSFGKPVDASGKTIDIPPFDDASKAGRDSFGRALAPNGQTIYVYFDAKKTHLALGLKMLGDLLRRDAHRAGLVVLGAALGPQKPDKSYDPNAPVIDLVHGALEQLAPDEAPKMLRALSSLLAQDPARAERVIVAFGRALDKLKAAHAASTRAGGLGALPLSDPRIVKLTDDVLPIADDMCTVPASGGASTMRTLMDVLNDLRLQAPDWPSRMGPLFVNHRISPLTPVDYSQPSMNGATDNRSSVQQLLSLLARADQCSLPLIGNGQSLAVQIIDMMAGLSPQTVSQLTSLITSLPGFVINIACPNLSNDINSLDDLAKSGSLDAFLPLARAFKDRGETALLVKLLVRLDKDYDTVLRPTEPDVARIMGSGAVEELLGILGETTTITDPTTGSRVADITADAIARLLNQHSSNVVDRHGQRVPSAAYLLLRPLQALDAQMRASPAALAAMNELSDDFYQIALARVTVNGVEKLENETLVPFLSKAFDDFAAAMPADPAQRRSDITTAENSIEGFIPSSTFGTLVAIETAIVNSPQKQIVDKAIVNLLTPNTTAKDDIFGAVVKLAAFGLQLHATSSSPSGVAITDLLRFAGDAIDPSRPVVHDAVNAVTKILTADSGHTVLNIERASLNPAPGETRAPAAIIMHVMQDVSDAGRAATTAAAPPISSTDVHDGVLNIVAFIRDQQSGLGWIFDMIKHRH